jgi:(p)ppGpp synthase/HD superfamily hydrolase
MRTIRSMTPEKQQQKALETMDIYAPLAGRMGMHWLREELEDLAFQVLNPDGRKSIIRRFIKLQNETGDVVQQIKGDLLEELDRAGIEGAEIQGRAKSPIRFGARCKIKSCPSRACQIFTGFGSLWIMNPIATGF